MQNNFDKNRFGYVRFLTLRIYLYIFSFFISLYGILYGNQTNDMTVFCLGVFGIILIIILSIREIVKFKKIIKEINKKSE